MTKTNKEIAAVAKGLVVLAEGQLLLMNILLVHAGKNDLVNGEATKGDLAEYQQRVVDWGKIIDALFAP